MTDTRVPNVPQEVNAVRVVAGTDFEPRSAVWRIWSQQNEIYLARRDIASELKTSLHSSGIYRHAFTKQAQTKAASINELMG